MIWPKITIKEGSVLNKPDSQVLLITHFKNDESDNNLFNKVDQLLKKKLSKRAKQFGFKSEKGENFVVHDTEEKLGYDALVVFGLGEKADSNLVDLQTEIANTLRMVSSLRFESVAIQIEQIFDDSAFDLATALSEALYLSQYRFDKYKSTDEKSKIKTITNFNIYIEKTDHNTLSIADFAKGVLYGEIVAKGVCLARDLVNEPGIAVTPKKLAETAMSIAKASGGAITCKVLGKKECEKLGMEAYLSVDKGSDLESQFIVLEYKGSKTGKSMCLVGKSITFDTGGLSLKPSKSMDTMKLDMAGGAVVLGVFQALSRLKDKKIGTVYGVLPACENMPSGKATRPGDIVRAMNGKTIEILNTDAEGRMALSDALVYAEKYLKSDYIIDLATLTGAIMVALGPDMTGLFGRTDEIINLISKAAASQGEQLWTMPLYKPYLKKMKGEIADLKNIGGTGLGGAITAAVFLGEFVENKNWAHLDIAGAAFNEDVPHGLMPKGGTGWGVRTMLKVLQTLN